MERAVLFDMDGVLVDSRASNVALYKGILAKVAGITPSESDILDCFHMPFLATISHFTGETDSERLEVYRAVLNNSPELNRSDLFQFPPTLGQTLQRLSGEYRLGVVTSRINAGVRTVFEQYPIGHLFDVVVAYEDYDHPKPHPQPLHVALGRLGIAANDAVYVGDSRTDIDAAVAAGMPSIQLSAETHERATIGIQDFAQVAAAVAKVF